MFIVRYTASNADKAGGPRQQSQSSLERHRDSNWFSFVMALNDSTRDFEGGGTCIRDAPPLSVDVGGCLIFVGAQPHSAAEVTFGTRLVLTGFVDLRAPLNVRDALTSKMRKFDDGFVCSSCREFARPHLRSNVRALERWAKKAGSSARGRRLLELLAARRVSAPPCDVDLAPLEEACRRFLAGGDSYALLEPGMRAFVRRVLASG